MQSSMYTPRQNGNSGCGQQCNARIEELSKMVQALEFRIRNLEAAAATSTLHPPTFPVPAIAPTNAAYVATPPTTPTTTPTPVPAAAAPNHRGGQRHQPKPIFGGNPFGARTSQPEPEPTPIIGGGSLLSPRTKDVNAHGDEHIKFAQTLHAEGLSQDEIVRRVLAKWPDVDKGTGKKGEANQQAMVESMVDMNTGRWATKLI